MSKLTSVRTVRALRTMTANVVLVAVGGAADGLVVWLLSR